MALTILAGIGYDSTAGKYTVSVGVQRFVQWFHLYDPTAPWLGGTRTVTVCSITEFRKQYDELVDCRRLDGEAIPFYREENCWPGNSPIGTYGPEICDGRSATASLTAL